MKLVRRLGAFLLALSIVISTQPAAAYAEISASHVYHNHMPNFWAYYDTSKYASTPVGSPIRYTYDGQVIDLKKNPPAAYPYFLPGGAPMPHDDLVDYYTHHAKTGAYLSWPWQTAGDLKNNHPAAGMQVTMSGSLLNNVDSFMYTNNVNGYNNKAWGAPWKNAYNNLKTTNGERTMDLVHFSGHHSMGPLAGNEYLLKDLIYQNAVMAQPFFLGDSFKSSKGFFPTELGFSERIIPVLDQLGIEWSVIGNNHFSRTLKDYPLLNDPGKDTMVSPPNRADLQNTSDVGSWVSAPMFNEKQVVYNKYPFASTPHWVRHVNPETGAEKKIIGIPAAQAESWEEGYQGSVKADALKPFEGLVDQKQFFVIAHDGDNSSGRAGSEDTWRNAGNVTYAQPGVKGESINAYLRTNTPKAEDVVHVQDGSWIDTRDSSSDPTWYHWRLPFGIWKGQFDAFNKATGLNLEPKKNLDGVQEGMTVSFEYGYHYLERNFALEQAALNYAKTAEQMWLDANPNHWKPSTALDREITYEGNQLNPWMMAYPFKGDPANNYKGGANPAELSWYFLLPALDSGFGYYDENVDDGVKPTLSFNQSLFFSKPYVEGQLSKDRTGPSVWWPQRYPYNPGSANVSKAEGWTLHYFDNTFGIYTYAYDVSGISDIKVKVRTHRDKQADAKDNTFRVYDPAALKAKGVTNIDPAKVSPWQEYSMIKRDLKPDINGVAWQPSSTDMFKRVPAQEIGDMYYTYFNDFRDQLVDYYIEAVDGNGNVTRSEIQTVYVGTGKYKKDASGKVVEDANGTIQGTHTFLVVDQTPPSAPAGVKAARVTDRSVTLQWTASTDNVGVEGYDIYRDGTKVGSSQTTEYTDRGLEPAKTYTYKIQARDKANNVSAASKTLEVQTLVADIEPPTAPTNVVSPSSTSSAVTLEWSASQDNYGVARYDIYRDGSKVGESTQLTYTDTSLAPAASYVYFIKAVDAAGNVSASSEPITVKTKEGNVVTIYYKQGYTNPYIHYRPTGGTWTTAPGVKMPAAEVAGYTKMTVNVGTAAGLEAVFNNGSGTWDNNGGKNYQFPLGVSTFNGGVITQGAPQADTTPPSVPANLTVTSKASDRVALAWNPSTDNTSVTGYEVFRDGVKIGISPTPAYTDTGLKAAASYMYHVIAYDAAQNKSAASTELRVTTDEAPKSSSVTVYYKQGYTQPNIHYRPVGGIWTIPPGVPIPPSELPGYHKITVDVGTAAGLEAVFNNGSGIWDNNGGRNYIFPLGVSTYHGGVITPGAPEGAASSTGDSLSAFLPVEFTYFSPWKMGRKSA
ncbi:carbohydrate binding domain-containing protein [Paenibacillus sp. FSL R7-0652]|uniref:carbohydrate binding domain-containing protein n=1 Tax=Paenibacillus sp. FSL R7-0652 TaxID=2921687 RepID=UPI003159CD35